MFAETLAQWNELKNMVDDFQLSDVPDIVKW
jgi:hypothetical protein